MGRPTPSPAKTRRAKVLVPFLAEARGWKVVRVETLRGTLEAEALLVWERRTTGTTRAAFARLVAWLVTLVACTRETCAAPTLEVMVSASATATASTTATAATVGTSAATAASSGVILLACGCDHPRELVGLAVRLHLSAELSLVETFMCYVVA